MNLVNCKCGANQNKIVFDCKNDPSDFGEYRRLTYMSCGQTVVRRGVVPGSDSHSLQDDWNAANAVADAPKAVSVPETCATCRFFYCKMETENEYSINEAGNKVTKILTRAFSECRFFPKEEFKFPDGWCGQWKEVKA